jgi:hypothetical protein
MNFCIHLECISLHIYQSEKCFKQYLQRKTEDISYVEYTFSVSLTVFKIIKQMGANAPELLHYTYIS